MSFDIVPEAERFISECGGDFVFARQLEKFVLFLR